MVFTTGRHRQHFGSWVSFLQTRLKKGSFPRPLRAFRSTIWILLIVIEAFPGVSSLGAADLRPFEMDETVALEADPPWGEEIPFFSASMLLGGLGAGLVARIKGVPVLPAFLKGAFGGGIGYGGRRVSAERFFGAGMVGRQLGAIGASITRNAAEGRRVLDQFSLPIGPLDFHFNQSQGFSLSHVRVDAVAVAIAGTLLLRKETSVDWMESLSAGAFVFWMSEDWPTGSGSPPEATTIDRTILAYEGTDLRPDDVLAHERVHVLQNDFLFYALGDPLQTWLFSRDPLFAFGNAHLALNLFVPTGQWALFHTLGIGYADRPTELEARFLAKH